MSRESLLLWITVPMYLLFIVSEIYIGKKRQLNHYKWQDSMVSISLGIIGAAFDFGFKYLTLGVLDWCNAHAIFHSNLIQVYPLMAWGLLFIGQDFCFYWLHRAEHYNRTLWAVHSNHHSSEHYNFTVALRSSTLQPLYRYVFYIPVAFMGFDGMSIMFMYAVNQVYQFFLHTELIGKLPKWYEAIFATPSHHRVHHASNVLYLDKNMGQVLIIWDKLFGTFQSETEPPVYGITSKIDSFNPLTVMFYEWKKLYKDVFKSTSLLQALKYMINPPGWSHDGSSKTSKELRKDLLNQNTTKEI